jgi:hypothetical protein
MKVVKVSNTLDRQEGSAVLIAAVSLHILARIAILVATGLDRPDAMPDGTIRGNTTKQNTVVKATRNITKTNLMGNTLTAFEFDSPPCA